MAAGMQMKQDRVVLSCPFGSFRMFAKGILWLRSLRYTDLRDRKRLACEENDLQKMQEQQAQQQEMEERKRIMIRSILEPEALERLHRIGLVKPEKKEQVTSVNKDLCICLYHLYN